MTPQFVDISRWQGEIDFVAYASWARQWDGIARIAMASSEGVGFVDPLFTQNRAKALAAGIDCIYYYHFARPDLNNAIAEANSQFAIVGSIRPQDIVMLDLERNEPQATSAWALTWLQAQEANYGKLPGVYASEAYIQERLQDARLARYPLWLAKWEFTPDERPACPAPWQSYKFVQYTDKATNIPGIAGTVDADIYLGKETPMTQIPTGWTDDGTTLKAPDGTPVHLGFRDHVLNSNWDPANVPLEPEQHLNLVEQSNPSLGAGQAQTFRWKRLGYTPKMGVYESWIGQELLWYVKQYSAQQAQISALQTQIAALQPDALAQENAALKAKIAQAQQDLA